VLVHTVFFWFKPDADPAVVARFEGGLQRLRGVPDVVDMRFGVPAATAKRSVVDDSYGWGLVLTFADVAAQERYQAHPLHEDFVGEFRDSWQKVVVYDVQA
jgi:Stress responsive A/B Barrel Domain